MEATAGNVTHNPGLSQGMARANNMDFNFNGNHYLMNRKPDYYVYLYTVSEHSQVVSRPPLISSMVLLGKKPGDKYALCGRFPQPLTTMQSNVDSNEVTPLLSDCRRFIMDICNPDNLGMNAEDQDAVIKTITNVGNNLNDKGVFWSLNGPGASKTGNLEAPTEDEIKRATARMERYYNKLVEKANTVQASKPADLPDTLTPEHHIAADYLTRNFGNQFQWHQTLSRLEDCELCGTKVKAGIAFHRTDEGGICVRDWARTVKAGAKTRAEAYDATGDEQFAPRVAATPTVAPPTKMQGDITVAPKKDIPSEK